MHNIFTKKSISISVVLALLWSILSLWTAPFVRAAELPYAIQNLKMLNTTNTVTTEFFEHQNLSINFDWFVPDPTGHLAAPIAQGDFFNIPIPDRFIIPNGSTYTDFVFKDPLNPAITLATGKITPGVNGGGVLKVEFTADAVGYTRANFNITMSARWNRVQYSYPVDTPVTVIFGDQTLNVTVKPQPPQHFANEKLNKWINSTLNGLGNATWNLRINGEHSAKQNVVITDTIGHIPNTNPPTNVVFLPATFRLRKGTFNANGSVLENAENVDLTGKLVFSPDMKSFTLTIGDILEEDDKKSYLFNYHTNYENGVGIRNSAVFSADGLPNVMRSQDFQVTTGSGAGADLNSKIKIIKMASDNNVYGLSGAVFRVTHVPTGQATDYTTDSMGVLVTPVLTPGRYRIQEISPPPGYVSNGFDITVIIEANRTNIRTLRNEPIRRDISVQKLWDPVDVVLKQPVAIELYADDVRVATQTLNEGNNFSHNFSNLRRYRVGKGNSEEIVYTVKEVGTIAGITTSYGGDMNNGLTVTNRFDPTNMDVTANVVWVGTPPPGETQPTVYFKLFRRTAGGAEEAVTTAPIMSLPPGTNSVTWTGLPSSTPLGVEYIYYVRETDSGGTELSGQIFNIAGSGGGLTVTNTWRVTNRIPQTGDSTNITALLLAMLLAGTTILIAKRKTSVNK